MRRARASRTASAVSGGGSVTWCAPLSSPARSEEHTSELQSHSDLVCRLLLEKKKKSPHPSQAVDPLCVLRTERADEGGGHPPAGGRWRASPNFMPSPQPRNCPSLTPPHDAFL